MLDPETGLRASNMAQMLLSCLYIGLFHPDKAHPKPFSMGKQKKDCGRLESTVSLVGTL